MRVMLGWIDTQYVIGSKPHNARIAQSPGVRILGVPYATQRINQKTAAMPIAAGRIGSQSMLATIREAMIQISSFASEFENSLICSKEVDAPLQSRVNR